jgi:uncharacterized protein YjbI with pentapeptide repeats
MDEDSIGFSAKAPVSAWNKRIGVDYPGVFNALIKATIAYATGNAAGGLSATVDGCFAFKLQDRPLPPAELAWLLIRRALAHAMARLSVDALAGRIFLGKESDTLIAALDHGLDDAEIWIDPAFFDRPADIPVVEAVRAPFDGWLRRYLHLDEAKAASVQRRLGAYFTFALRREWAEHSETYAPIDAEIRKQETPFAKATVRERAWLRNAAYLQRQINEPVFDETFGLAQIYVPLRAWYLETPAGRKGRGQEDDTHERRLVVDLEQHLDAWFRSGNKKDAIRVICGGPGSGKTSSAKIWAAKLGCEGHCVLFIPLHRIELRDERPDVQAALWEFLHDLDILPADPLDSSDGEPRLLILFDGLDELAMQGHAGQEIARNFVEAVERKLDLLNDRQNRYIQVVFGGRDIAAQAARVPNHQMLHVLPYHGAEGSFKDPGSLLQTDDYACGRWWRQYGDAIGEAYRGIPAPLQGEDLAEVTAQPLLNYLLALSYRRGEVDFSSAPNLNLIYRDLLDAVYERRWGPGKHPTQRRLTRKEFDDLLDELSLAAWQASGRTVTARQAQEACERVNLHEQLAAFKEGARAGAISLLAAFYFRQAGKIDGEQTFEFTHKSFGEYLFARRLVRVVEDIHKDREVSRNNRHRGKTIEDALIAWIRIVGPAVVDRYILDFVKREVTFHEDNNIREWRSTFSEIFIDQLSNGLPMHLIERFTFREMCLQGRNAERALLAIIYVCGTFLNRRFPKRTASRVPLSGLNTYALRTCIMRLEEDHLFEGTSAAFCLGWLDARGQRLGSTDLSYGNLDGSDLSGCDLSHCNCEFTNFRGTNLQKVDFYGSHLELADLSNANLEEARLYDTDLDNAILDGANLQRTDLRGVRNLHRAEGLDKVKNWRGAKIERKWVELIGLDSTKIDLQVVDDVEHMEDIIRQDYG